MLALVILILSVVVLVKWGENRFFIQALCGVLAFATLLTTTYIPVGDGSWEVKKIVPLTECNVEDTAENPIFVVKEDDDTWTYCVKSKTDSDKFVMNDEEKMVYLWNLVPASVEIIKTNEVEPSLVKFRKANNPLLAFSLTRETKYVFYVPEGSVVLDLSKDG